MAVTFLIGEDNGAAAGSPAKGTTRTFSTTNVNWKNIDDTTTSFTGSPITAGNNSFDKYQFGIFSGTFNTVSNVKFQHTSGAFGAGLALKVGIKSGYATPAIASNGTLSGDITAVGDIATGMVCLLSPVGPQAGGSLILNATGYTQYIATQLQTTTAAAAGDTVIAYFGVRWDES